MQVLPLSEVESVATGANLLVILTHADLTDGDAAQTINLFNVNNKDAVQLVRMELPTVFDSSTDASLTSTTITVGDGNSATVFLGSTELNPSGTEVFQKGGALTSATAQTYTADDTVDAFFACTALKLLSDHDSGEIRLFFNYRPYGRA